METSVVTAEEANKLWRYLVITRKMKVYDEVVRLHDPLRRVVKVDGHYRALLHDKSLEEGTFQTPFVSSSIPSLRSLTMSNNYW